MWIGVNPFYFCSLLVINVQKSRVVLRRKIFLSNVESFGLKNNTGALRSSPDTFSAPFLISPRMSRPRGESVAPLRFSNLPLAPPRSVSSIGGTTPRVIHWKPLPARGIRGASGVAHACAREGPAGCSCFWILRVKYSILITVGVLYLKNAQELRRIPEKVLPNIYEPTFSYWTH
jgi:hypothetical protein